jgi:acyl-CoA thioesterase-1
VRRSIAAVSILTLLTIACDRAPREQPAREDGAGPGFSPASRSGEGTAQAVPRIVVLGDSLSAGYGLSSTDAFPAVLERKLHAAGYNYQVVNAGVSGDTSAGGLRRLDWALEGEVRIVIVALGANDGLRGLSVDEMKRNLSTIITRARGRGAMVLLAGMESPPNLGAAYTGSYRQAYRELAREHGVAFVPFLLEGVAGRPELNQGDGIHPNVEGARRVADHVWTALQPLLDRRPTS